MGLELEEIYDGELSIKDALPLLRCFRRMISACRLVPLVNYGTMQENWNTYGNIDGICLGLSLLGNREFTML
jgi:hypothetical protein